MTRKDRKDMDKLWYIDTIRTAEGDAGQSHLNLLNDDVEDVTGLDRWLPRVSDSMTPGVLCQE